jgi:hypothetical protein
VVVGKLFPSRHIEEKTKKEITKMEAKTMKNRDIVAGGFTQEPPHQTVYAVYGFVAHVERWLGFIYPVEGGFQARPNGQQADLPIRPTKEEAGQDL